VDIAGRVVESKPPKRLVLTWAWPKELGDKLKHSRLTFDIEPHGKVIRLTVTHEDLEKDQPMLAESRTAGPRYSRISRHSSRRAAPWRNTDPSRSFGSIVPGRNWFRRLWEYEGEAETLLRKTTTGRIG
jgi:hypothetical protein